MTRRTAGLGMALALLASGPIGCGDADPPPAGGTADAAPDAPAEAVATLGPHDGRDLPPHDLERVQAGDAAPDFTLASFRGGPVTLSDFRGSKDVVLVFYRGHW